MKIAYWPMSSYDHVIGHRGNIVILALEDPYTPVIVAHKRTDASSTFDAAFGEGEIIGGRTGPDYRLTEAELELLEDHYDECNEWFDDQRPDGWEG